MNISKRTLILISVITLSGVVSAYIFYSSKTGINETIGQQKTQENAKIVTNSLPENSQLGSIIAEKSQQTSNGCGLGLPSSDLACGEIDNTEQSFSGLEVVIDSDERKKNIVSSYIHAISENLQLSDIKSKQLASVIDKKISSDATIKALMSDLISDELFDSLLTNGETEWSPEQLALRDEILNKTKDPKEDLENNREQYEDSLRNLLTKDEITSFENYEKDVLKKYSLETMELILSSTNEAIPELQPYQKIELNLVFQQYSNIEITDYRIGSTIQSDGGSLGSVGGSVAEISIAFQKDLLDVLSPEQQTKYMNY